jgi:hypothetical protein
VYTGALIFKPCVCSVQYWVHILPAIPSKKPSRPGDIIVKANSLGAGPRKKPTNKKSSSKKPIDSEVEATGRLHYVTSFRLGTRDDGERYIHTFTSLCSCSIGHDHR